MSRFAVAKGANPITFLGLAGMGDLMASPEIDRLNLGSVPTNWVQWEQPHEGNLFEFLYRRRAIQAKMLKIA